MPNLIAFVDAGFLKAEGARTLGTRPTRASSNAQGAVSVLKSLAASQGCALLRTYWYDGAFEVGTPYYQKQRPYLDAISSTPGIQIRLGHTALTGWLPLALDTSSGDSGAL
jgi:hypothetical protein